METGIDRLPVIHAEIRRELYSLLTMLFADEKIAEMAGRNRQFAHLSNEVSRSVLPLKFLTVAAAVRGVLDGGDDNPRLGDGDVCGRYFPNAAKNTEESLSLRKACNCAIHAESTRFLQQDNDRPNFAVFDGRIMLRGYHQKRRSHPWKAEIDMEKFASACLVAINSAQE